MLQEEGLLVIDISQHFKHVPSVKKMAQLQVLSHLHKMSLTCPNETNWMGLMKDNKTLRENKFIGFFDIINQFIFWKSKDLNTFIIITFRTSFLCSCSHETEVDLWSVVVDTCWCWCCLASVFCCWSVGAPSFDSKYDCTDGEDGRLLRLYSCCLVFSLSILPLWSFLCSSCHPESESWYPPNWVDWYCIPTGGWDWIFDPLIGIPVPYH